MNPIMEYGEAEQLLRCGPLKLRELLAEGVYPAVKEGKEWVIPREAFLAALNARALAQAATRRKNHMVIPAGIPVGQKQDGRGRPARPLNQ